MNLRPVGWCIILYAFMNSYYGVGATKFVIASRDLPFPVLLPGVIYGLSWMTYFIAGAGLVLRKKWFLPLMICASSGALATTSYISYSYLNNQGPDPKYLFQIVRPLPELFISGLSIYVWFFGLRMEDIKRECPGDRGGFQSEKGQATGGPVFFIRTMVAVGAFLPWLAGFSRSIISGDDGVIKIFAGKGILIALFLTMWFDIPFIIIALLSKALAQPDAESGNFIRYKTILTGSACGAAIAGGFVYWTMWGPVFDSFMMPISPPMIFAGAASGAGAGWILSRAGANRT